MNNKRNQSNQIIPIVVSALLSFTIWYLAMAFFTTEIDFRKWDETQRLVFLLEATISSAIVWIIYKSEENKA